MPPRYDALIERFLSGDLIQSTASRMILIALQEDAIESLADNYYAGITDEEGEKLLSMMAEIGGYEALNILRDVVRHEVKRKPLRIAAAKGLLFNESALSAREVKAVKRLLSRLTSKS